MEQNKIFDGITPEDLARMLDCFHTKHKKYAAGSTLSFTSADKKLGILLDGDADLIRLDYDGYRNIMEHLTVGDVFGEMFVQETANELAVVCNSKCEVLYVDYRDVVKRCPNACNCHSVLVANLLGIMTQKVRKLRSHLEVLSQRTLRTKLLTYFRMQAKAAGSRSFVLPFSLSDLADYLFVDRSAMLREMKNLREEGYLSSHGRKITLSGDE